MFNRVFQLFKIARKFGVPFVSKFVNIKKLYEIEKKIDYKTQTHLKIHLKF